MRNAVPSGPNAARTMKRIAPAFPRAAWHRCNACRKTCRACRRAARARCVRWKHRRAQSPKSEPAAGSAPPPAAAKPAETATEPAPKTAGKTAKKPSSAQVAAIRSACRSDYQRTCAGVPTGGAAALNCLETNKSKLSASCQQAVSAASGGGATPASGPTAAAPAEAPAPAPALVLRPMRPREELFVLRSACGGDVRALCGGIPVGGGRILQCLVGQAASLSPACQDVLSQFALRR